jgi:hypothetical protein
MTIYNYLQMLQPQLLALALLMSIPVVVVSYSMHEAAHWLAGRTFGVTSKLTFFPLRGKSRFWFLSIMGMRFDDAAERQLSRSQIRITAIAGPAWDLLFGAACVCIYNHLPGPELLRAILACVAVAVLFSTVTMNVLPWPIGNGNDGWRVLHPD